VVAGNTIALIRLIPGACRAKALALLTSRCRPGQYDHFKPNPVTGLFLPGIRLGW